MFGDFTAKSGRKVPYFFNAGHFNTGRRLAKLGVYYARTIAESKLACDVLFGPAYKGIPLAASTAIALATQHDVDLPYCYNRKEAKDHGEGGTIVGGPLAGRVLVLDDVITAGTASRESAEIIKAHGAALAGLVIALDREECATSDTSAANTAAQQVTSDLGVPVLSIATASHLIAFLRQTGQTPMADRVAAHKAKYSPQSLSPKATLEAMLLRVNAASVCVGVDITAKQLPKAAEETSLPNFPAYTPNHSGVAAYTRDLMASMLRNNREPGFLVYKPNLACYNSLGAADGDAQLRGALEGVRETVQAAGGLALLDAKIGDIYHSQVG